MNEFKPGDRVVYVGDWFDKFPLTPVNCQRGATAEVLICGAFLRIKWDRNNPLCGDARNGGYYRKDFILEGEMPFLAELEEILEAQELYDKLTA